MKKNIVNKRNLLFFEGSTMRELYERMDKWQKKHKKRFLSVSVQPDQGSFCCITLTNPSEVVITSEDGKYHADVCWWGRHDNPDFGLRTCG